MPSTPIKIAADLHTHTIASGHALSTLQEMVDKAKSLGHKGIAITDHGCQMPGSPIIYYFSKLSQLPDVMSDILVLKGMEANIVNKDAPQLDVDEEMRRKLDWIIMSLHTVCIEPLDPRLVTQIWLKMIELPYVDMIGHSEQECYKYDYDLVTRACAENHVVVELNAGSAIARPGNEQNLRELALCCKRNGTKVAVNTDAHATVEMGTEQNLLSMLENMNFPGDQIINSSMERLLKELKLHGRPVADRVKDHFKVDL